MGRAGINQVSEDRVHMALVVQKGFLRETRAVRCLRELVPTSLASIVIFPEMDLLEKVEHFSYLLGELPFPPSAKRGQPLKPPSRLHCLVTGIMTPL